MANYTILLIDYEPRSIERFRQPLMTAGYSVEVATDGVAGLEAFERMKPDMVLVEAMIPKKHGFEVCQEIKRSQNGRRVPVLITTGVYKGRKYRTQALHIYGCDEYIEKPIAAEQLLAIVARFLGGGNGAARTAAASEPEAGVDAGGSGEPVPVPSSGPAPQIRRSGDAPSGPGRGGPVARAAAKPVAIVRDLTEDEIMARLDAILPTAEASILSPSPESERAPEPRAVVAEAEPFAEIESGPDDVDPFRQMQDELNAELGSLSAALDRAPAPILEPEPEPAAMPSDQASAPSLLESLAQELEELEPRMDASPGAPLPEAQAEEPAPAARAEEPVQSPVGRVVHFDAKRGRKGKKSGRRPEGAEPEPAPGRDAGPPPDPSVAPPETSAEPKFKIPSGSLVASTLEGETTQRGVPIWVWAAAAVTLLAGAYFVFLRGGAPGPTAGTEPPPVESANLAGDRAPSSTTSLPDTLGPPAEPSATTHGTGATSPEQAGPVAPSSAEPRRGTEGRAGEAELAPRSRPAEPANPPAETPVARERETARSEASRPVPVHPKPAPAEPAPAPVESAPAAPTTVLGGVAAGGVATILPPPPESKSGPTVAAGALVSMDEVDAPPSPLTRKLPVYSMQARQLRIQGTVVLKVLVDEKGAVADVQVVTPVPGADVTESAVKAAKQWTYRPATKDGVPVKVWKIESVGFKL